MVETKTKDWQKVIDESKKQEQEDSEFMDFDEELLNFSNSDDNNKPDVKTQQNNALNHPKYNELEDKLTETEKLANKYWNDFLRIKAEMDNYQRRAERDLANAHKYGVEKIASALLAVVDNLERCIESKNTVKDQEILNLEVVGNLYVGVELTLKMFMEVLHKFEIKAINPVGEVFDYQYHNAVQTIEDDTVDVNTVLKVIQKGYMLKDKLLRPAMVVVSKKTVL